MAEHSASAAGRPSIEAKQLAQLNKLIELLVPANRFYTSKLGGSLPTFRSVEEYSARVPFTSKEELVDDQREHPPYGTNLTYPLERYTRYSQTSATTGQPMRWLDTAESWRWMVRSWERVYSAAGVTPEDRIFFAFSFGPFLGFWTAFEAATQLGCLAIPGGGMRSAGRLQTIIENKATVLCCTPTYAIWLGQTAAAEKFDLSNAAVKRIIVAGEPGGSVPGTRAQIESLWNGARVVDHHGMTETGPVTYGCPANQGVLHVIEDAFIAEIVDLDSGKHVEPGNTGELVLTNLGRLGSPLLRYRTGDLVRQAAGARCECGAYDLPLEGGILSRADSMVTVRGVNVYPSALEDVLRSTGGVGEYRVEISTANALTELLVEVEPSDTEDVESLTQRLEVALHRAFNLRIPVRRAAQGTLPRFEMKAKRWIVR